MKNKFWNHFIAVATGSAIGTVFLGVMLSYPFKTQLKDITTTFSMLGTIAMPIITVIGFAYIREQIKATQVPSKREAYSHLMQDGYVSGLIRAVPEDKLIQSYIAAIKHRANNDENDVQLEQPIEWIETKFEALFDLNPKVAVYLSPAEQEARWNVRNATQAYLTKGLNQTYWAYRNSMQSKDLSAIRKYHQVAIDNEANLNDRDKKMRAKLRREAIAAEKVYNEILERRMEENRTH